MTSLERVSLALQHKEADRVPLDLGASATTGMQVDTVYGLRQALGLDRPGTPVKVIEPYQMLGEIGPDLREALGSAAGMEPCELKKEFGEHITFWGGGVDTQHTLPFGTPDEVRKEAGERLKTFGPGGGFVFNTTHNVQVRVPIENMLAMYETVRDRGRYPLR